MAQIDFDTEEYQNTENNYNPIPKGNYVLKCLEAELQDARSGNGQYIKAKFEVSRGEYTGRKIFVNFNINNASETAQRIGRKELASWGRACGKPKVTDTDQLLEIEFEAVVGIERGRDNYADSNRILDFVPKEGAAPAAAAPAASKPAAPAASKPAPTSSAGKKSPWDD